MRKRLFRYFIGLFFLLLCFFLLKSAYAEPKLNASLSSNRITPSQTATLTVQVEWAKSEGNYGFAVPEPALENLSLTRRGESQEFFSRGSEEWARKTFELEFSPLGPGNASIREFSVAYVDPATQRRGSFQVSAMPLSVAKPAGSFPVLPALTGTGIFLLAAGAGLFVFFTRKRKEIASEPAVSKEEFLVQRIKSMVESRGPSKETFHQVAAEFRQFISDYYKTGQPQATGDEFLRILKSKDIPFEEWQKIKDLLEKIQEAQYLPEQSAAGDYQYLQRDIVSFIESKKVSQFTNAGAVRGPRSA